jgi:hypothetical protein
MTLPRLTITDHAYNLAWANRRPGESIPQLITRIIVERFTPHPAPVGRPLLTWVEVVE